MFGAWGWSSPEPPDVRADGSYCADRAVGAFFVPSAVRFLCAVANIAERVRASRMFSTASASLLRIFVGELVHHKSRPLYEAIVMKAREMHLAGATVLRGPLGFGRSSRLHMAKPVRLSTDLSVVIEIVDTPVKIEAFLPVLDEMMTGGLVTLENIRMLTRQDVMDRTSGI
jgi:uncharacterized protein